MPKITKAGGPSYEGDITPPPGFTGTWGDGEPEAGPGEDVEAVEGETVETTEAHGDDSNVATDPDGQEELLPRPAANAPKADWLAYARQETGEDIDDGDYTKAELVDLVGKD